MAFIGFPIEFSTLYLILMKSHLDIPDNDFLLQIEEATIEPELFTHEAHLRLGWILINAFGKEEAEKKMCDLIYFLDNTLSDGSKYNKTITVACTQILYAYMQRSGVNSFTELIKRYPELIFDFKTLLLKHYSPKVLFQNESKFDFFPPDIKPISN